MINLSRCFEPRMLWLFDWKPERAQCFQAATQLQSRSSNCVCIFKFAITLDWQCCSPLCALSLACSTDQGKVSLSLFAVSREVVKLPGDAIKPQICNWFIHLDLGISNSRNSKPLEINLGVGVFIPFTGPRQTAL